MRAIVLRRDPLHYFRGTSGSTDETGGGEHDDGDGDVEGVRGAPAERGIKMQDLMEQWLHAVDTLKRRDATPKIRDPKDALEGALCIR